MEQKACVIIGEPIMSFPWGYDEEAEACGQLKLRMLREISLLHTKGYTTFVVPMDSGIGLYAAELVIGLREHNPNLTLTCVIPYEEQATKWTPELRERYFNVLANCTQTMLTSTDYTEDCEFCSVLDAIDEADVVLAVQTKDPGIGPAMAVALEYAIVHDHEIITLVA